MSSLLNNLLRIVEIIALIGLTYTAVIFFIATYKESKELN